MVDFSTAAAEREAAKVWARAKADVSWVRRNWSGFLAGLLIGAALVFVAFVR